MHADMMKAKETGSALPRMDAHIKAMESKVESLKALKPATEGPLCGPQRRAKAEG